MLILGIDTSCDDTSAAVLDDLRTLSSKVRSQVDLHENFGGIVPEEASRAHGEAIDRIVGAALEEAGATPADLGLISVTNGPGLLGSLLVGLNYGRGLALAGKIPFHAADHLYGHIVSPFLSGEAFPLPAVTIAVSGGHTLIGVLEADMKHRFYGSTLDDAVGEVIDKLGRRMGFPYPAGPHVDQAALAGNPKAVRFTRPLRGREGFDFSFSGLKTAFLRQLEKEPKPVEDLFASLLEAMFDSLLDRIVSLATSRGIRYCLFCGGVAASEYLRRFMAERLPRHGITPRFPERRYCTDNAAMIAAAGFFAAAGRTFEASGADLDADAYAQVDW